MRQRILVVFILVYVMILPGCWDLEEVDRRAFITALGIDANSNRSVVLTAQLPLLQKMLPPGATGKGDQGKNFHTISAKSSSVFSAFGNLQAKTSRRLVIQQNRLVIIGEETARSGVRPVLDWLMKSTMLPPQALIFIASHRLAGEILSATPATLNMPGLEFVITKTLISKYDHSYFIPIWRFQKIMLNKTEDLYAPLLDFDFKEGLYIKEGLAVFNGEYLAGELNPKETQTFGFLTNQMHAGNITYRFTPGTAGENFSLREVMATTRLKVLLFKGKPSFIVKTEVKGTLSETAGVYRRLSPEKIKRLEKIIEIDTKLRITGLIQKLQSLHSDPIKFGEELRVQHYDLWKKINWKDIFPTVPFKITVKAKIIRDGVLR